MTKKRNNRQKHQKDVADTSEEELNESPFQGKRCLHASKAVNFARVKKALKTGDISTCNGCAKSVSSEQDDSDPQEQEKNEVWLCLQCGYQGCGRMSTDKHMLQHFKTIHSDCHSLVLSATSGCVWCYDCDDAVQMQQSQNLKQCVEFILKLKTNNNKVIDENNERSSSQPQQSSIEHIPKEQKSTKSTSSSSGSMKNNSQNDLKGKKTACNMTSVKGLRNLGNTCYFNAVMQNLSQTYLLRNILEEICAPEYKWEIPQLVVVDDSVVEDSPAETIKVTLPKEFQFVHSFLQFLTKMSASSHSKVEVLNPDDLFKNLQKKAPQFQNYLQQDSHELLRQFLDGIRQDEMKRHKKAILRYFNITNPGPDDIDDEMKKLIKAYGSFANHTVIDKVFGGLLISTVLCEECKMSSQVFEPFMDMSLPLFEEKQESNDHLDGGKQNDKPLRIRKSDIEQDENNEYINKPNKDYSKPSKYQEKKMKQLEKKEKKRNKKVQNKKSLDNQTQEDFNKTADSVENAAENEADEKPESTAENVTLADVTNTPPLRLQVSVTGVSDHSESGTVTTHTNGVVDDGENTIQQDEDDKALILFGEEVPLSHDSESAPEKHQTDVSALKISFDSAMRNDALSDVETISSDVDEKVTSSNKSHGEPESSLHAGLDERMHALSMQVTELRIRRDSDRQGSILSSPASSVDDGEYSRANLASEDSGPSHPSGNEAATEEDLSHSLSDTELREWIRKSLSTLKPRHHIAPLECSIDSCLMHFTKPELLMGNNKFRCENCSELKRKATGDKKAAVYSNASKQLLIFSPPAILTLHLKRFQQVGMSLRKINRFVEFPLILDLAPYCSSACSILPHVSSVKDEILYSLYGLVEHSGHLRSGHYTAFVKVCRRTLNRAFLCQLPLGQCDLEQLLRRFTRSASASEDSDCPEDIDASDEGRWFYVSDGQVRESSESQVLKCQAYLLFYERIK